MPRVRTNFKTLAGVLNHGRDNHHYESLRVVEVPETSENPTPSFRVHNVIRKRTQLLAVILNILLYRYYIGLQESARGHNHSLLHVADQSGLQGVDADRLSWRSEIHRKVCIDPAWIRALG